MNLHRPVETACITAIQNIFSESRHADKVIEHALRTQRKWGSRDRRMFAETVYDIVRWRRLLSVLSGSEEARKLVEYYAAEKDQFRTHASELPLAIRESYPDWMVARMTQEVGLERASSLLRALNEPAPHTLRANELKATRDTVQARLAEEEIETVPVAQPTFETPHALRLIKRQNIFKSRAFQDGWVEMQDAGSQLIAPFLKPKAGEFIIDACAGGGGKALHLAALMKNRGRVLAMDVQQWKLDELQRRARRAGASNIETRLIDSTKVIKRLEGKADRVLLDVPCSGTGVIRRNPDAKWKLTQADLDRLAELQMNILVNYSKMVKPGGVLVYSTCSVLPSENLLRVQDFANRTDNEFQIETQWQVSPIETPFDGFFACRLTRALN